MNLAAWVREIEGLKMPWAMMPHKIESIMWMILLHASWYISITSHTSMSLSDWFGPMNSVSSTQPTQLTIATTASSPVVHLSCLLLVLMVLVGDCKWGCHGLGNMGQLKRGTGSQASHGHV